MKIACTSGCYDLIHAGHIWMFQKMRKTVGATGLVIVLLNDDNYLLRTKGRVITPLDERMTILLALKNIDVVIPFKDDNPCQIIQTFEPDFWFKGPEYQGIEIPETPVVASYGGKIVFSQDGPTVHTRDILSRIHQFKFKQTGGYTNLYGTDFAGK